MPEEAAVALMAPLSHTRGAVMGWCDVARLDAIRQKAKTAEVPCAVSAPSTERLQDASAPFPSPASSGNATHFGDCRSRLQDWSVACVPQFSHVWCSEALCLQLVSQ